MCHEVGASGTSPTSNRSPSGWPVSRSIRASRSRRSIPSSPPTAPRRTRPRSRRPETLAGYELGAAAAPTMLGPRLARGGQLRLDLRRPAAEHQLGPDPLEIAHAARATPSATRTIAVAPAAQVGLVGRRQDRLVEPADRIEQQPAPLGVELAGDVVEQEQRQLVALLRQQVGLGQDQPEQHPPLLALRSVPAHVRARLAQLDVVQMRAAARRAPLDVAAPRRPERRQELRPVGVGDAAAAASSPGSPPSSRQPGRRAAARAAMHSRSRAARSSAPARGDARPSHASRPSGDAPRPASRRSRWFRWTSARA